MNHTISRIHPSCKAHLQDKRLGWLHSPSSTRCPPPNHQPDPQTQERPSAQCEDQAQNRQRKQLTISVKILPVPATGRGAGPGSVLGCAKIQANRITHDSFMAADSVAGRRACDPYRPASTRPQYYLNRNNRPTLLDMSQGIALT